MFDKIFKMGILLLGIVFLALYYNASQNGRYQRDADEFGSFDTRTGDKVFIDKGKVCTVNIKAGKAHCYNISVSSDEPQPKELGPGWIPAPAPGEPSK